MDLMEIHSGGSDSPTSEHPVLIIGGGLAGLATAVGLASQGVASTVIESRGRLGGRASSFHDPTQNQWIDNCQHVSMGCCTNFRWFCELIGLADSFRREETLYFMDPDGRANRFAANLGPAPFHLIKAFAGLSYLNWREKVALARGIRALAHSRSARLEGTIQAWLHAQRQPERVIQRFWHVVLVSALSESLDRISIAAARKVLVDGFLTHRDAWVVEIPRVPLQDLYGARLTAWLQARGTSIQLSTAAERLLVREGVIDSVTLRDGTSLAVGECVLAVPFQRVAAILPEECAAHPYFQQQSGLETAPISSFHFWFDRPITDLPHAVFVEGLVQWVFNRTAMEQREGDTPDEWYYQVVISNSRELQQLETDQVKTQILEELSRVFPETRQANVLNSRQVTEHRAVFSPLPGSTACRPGQQSPIPNLQLAGDYTQTGWPATMEGAVRSGLLAAENLLKRRGIEVQLVRPHLPVSRWSRWLLGIQP